MSIEDPTLLEIRELNRRSRGRVYRLYLWVFHPGCTPSRTRGRCVATFSFYKDLVKEAKRRAVAAGYPKSRWSDLFDWNL